jgi:anti-sigma28 factor (negative regulator of flagellin synthesis)
MRRTVVECSGEVRTGKVRELRRLVETGQYRPDPGRIAVAMVSYARRSMLARPLDGFGNA